MHDKIVQAFFEFTMNGFAGLILSLTSSIYMGVNSPPILNSENIVNVITQVSILIATISGFILKYREIKKIKKNNKIN